MYTDEGRSFTPPVGGVLIIQTWLLSLPSPPSYQHFTPDLSRQLVPDINIRSSYISHSPREKKIQVAIWRVSAGKKPWETWLKMPSSACKFMLIEAGDMWEHFLLTFNKDKQTSRLPLRINNNTFYQCLILNIIAIQITIISGLCFSLPPTTRPPDHQTSNKLIQAGLQRDV